MKEGSTLLACPVLAWRGDQHGGEVLSVGDCEGRPIPEVQCVRGLSGATWVVW